MRCVMCNDKSGSDVRQDANRELLAIREDVRKILADQIQRSQPSEGLRRTLTKIDHAIQRLR